jgi:phosphoribosyl 1,2-cyclic phosphodiesterase
MGFASLGSGSKGNGTLVALADQVVLVDCGFTLRQTERRLSALGVGPGDIAAILVSHEHADHISGVTPLSHKYTIPVYASYGTLKKIPDARFAHPFDGDELFAIDGISVNPVRVPHDAREPTQFVLGDGVETVGVLSDLGCVTSHVIEQFKACTHLLMEANHDRQMLLQGSYPPHLKRRVGADHGHLSNDQALSLLEAIAHDQLHVVIGHVSEQNNCMERLRGTFAHMTEAVAKLDFATQQQGFEWIGTQPIRRQSSFA